MGKGKKTKTTAKNNNGKKKQDEDIGCEDGSCGACGNCYSELNLLLAHTKGKLDETKLELADLKEKEEDHKVTLDAMRERIDELAAERDQLNLRLESTSVRKRQSGSVRWSPCRHLSGEDKPAQEILTNVVKDGIFPVLKFLPPNWEQVDDRDNSIYMMLMRTIEPLNDQDKEVYWTKKVREASWYKFLLLKRQATNKIRDKMYGKPFFGNAITVLYLLIVLFCTCCCSS